MKSVRTYFAGIGSGGALLAAVIAGFLTLGAVVGFNGLPTGTAETDDSAVLVSNAPEIAAGAAADPAAAPAATAAAKPSGASSSAPSGSGTSGSRAGTPDRPGGPTSLAPGPAPAPAAGPGRAPSGPGSGSGGSGDGAGVVGQVDDTVSGTTGVDLGLGEKAKPITDILDETLGGVKKP